MPKISKYDVVVIGMGSAGFSAVEAAVAQGASVCAIEQEKLGGECPNFACVPSKAMLKTAKMYRMAQHMRSYGINVGTVAYDFSRVMEYRNGVVEAITGGGERGDRYVGVLKKMGVDVKYGNATFVDAHMIDVNGENISGKTFVIATGTVDFIPPIAGIEKAKVKSWKQTIQLKKQPKSMAVIGGGPVGCEIATFYATFGTRVVLLQGAQVVLNREDAEISALAQEALKSLDIEVVTNARVEGVMSAAGGVFGVKASMGDRQETFAVEHVVLATGKRANLVGLNVDELGLGLDERGYVKTNKEQRTNVRHVYAAGDVSGGMQFTHTAHHQGWVAGNNAALTAKKKRKAPEKADERVVPRVTFIIPEVASVGMTQEQVKQTYKKTLVGRWKIAMLGRAVTENERFGMLKIVAHPKTRKVLGGHMIGDRAGEVIHEIALAIHLNATIDKLANMIHAFPTYSEAIPAAAVSAQVE